MVPCIAHTYQNFEKVLNQNRTAQDKDGLTSDEGLDFSISLPIILLHTNEQKQQKLPLIHIHFGPKIYCAVSVVPSLVGA